VANDTEPPYCGFCIRALDDHAVCGSCEWCWTELLTEPEARAFQAAWMADPGGDCDVRWGNAWLAVERERGHAIH
jgi:hypothetical protein